MYISFSAGSIQIGQSAVRNGGIKPNENSIIIILALFVCALIVLISRRGGNIAVNNNINANLGYNKEQRNSEMSNK